MAQALGGTLNGIMSDRAITKLLDSGSIGLGRPLVKGQIQPASLDLRLGAVAYRTRASFLPGPGVRVAERLKDLTMHEIDISAGAVLETGCVYVVPLLEVLDLPADVSASTNPKSSTGRLDIFTRVIADGTGRFDAVAAGYCGPLFAEVSPKTFPILMREGSRLSQIRFRIGDASVSSARLQDLHASERLVDVDGVDLTQGVPVSIDLVGADSGKLVGYRAKRHAGVVDIDLKGGYQASEFWEPIMARGDRSLILDPDEFYILASKEAVQIPPDYAAEMVPFDSSVGEFRVHYAGFFDPGFGYAGAGGQGSRAVLEVRSREVPFIMEHGQVVGRLVFERMLDRPQSLYGQMALKSNYQKQGLRLAKHFVG